MVNRYELLTLVSGNYTEDELEPVKQKTRELIEKDGGKILLEDSLGKRKLAYAVNHEQNGYYLLCEFELEGANLKKLTTDLRLSPEIMRHTIVKREASAPTFRELTQQQLQREREQQERMQQANPEVVAEVKPEAPKAEPKPKMTVEQLDEKIDEILQGDIM